MNPLDSLQVTPFTQDRVPNPYPGGDLPWQMYHTVRNALVEACRRYGPTGPMGVVKIDPDVSDPYDIVGDSWPLGDSDPWYYVIDDQYNHELYCYAELYGDNPLNAGWLLDVTETLREFDGWGLGINNIQDSYLLIFADRLLVKGRLAKCRTAAEVVETATQLLQGRDD